MPKKKVEAAVEPAPPPRNALPDTALIEHYFKLKDWLAGEDQRYKDHTAPVRSEMKSIENEFLARLNERGSDNTKTDNGTAYKSRLLSVSVTPEGAAYERDGEEYTGRDALLEFALDNWADYGSDMLMISAQKDAVKRYMEEHEGKAPPGVKTSTFVRVNIKRA